MQEQSKSARRRYHDGAFHRFYFVGRGLDVGAGPDSLARYTKVFSQILHVDPLDQHNGDGQSLYGVENQFYDFVHSSHCLEHLRDPHEALLNWIRVTKVGGHIIFCVPDFTLYEHEHWPSIFSGEHLWAFTTDYSKSSKRVLHLPSFLCTPDLSNVSIERITLIRDFFDETYRQDQTLLPNVECAIEVVLRRER